jgi:hypothetical protein
MNSFRTLLLLIATPTLLLCRFTMAQSEAPSTTQPQTQTQSSTSVMASASTGSDPEWHLDVSPYLWFAGAHGSVGAAGRCQHAR